MFWCNEGSVAFWKTCKKEYPNMKTLHEVYSTSKSAKDTLRSSPKYYIIISSPLPSVSIFLLCDGSHKWPLLPSHSSASILQSCIGQRWGNANNFSKKVSGIRFIYRRVTPHQQMGTHQQIMVITDRIKRRVTGASGISAIAGTSAKGETSVSTRVRNLRRFFGLLPRVYTRFYPRYFWGRAFSIS